ncbi:MAG: hypothetical protein IJ468_05275 [Lachnospiraceae bacterium]|nr:hypothetical protein [Lachnospiraceae bacterium]
MSEKFFHEFSKEEIIGAFIYQIARYEKSLRWNRIFLAPGRLKQLLNSLETIERLIYMLESDKDLYGYELEKMINNVKDNKVLRHLSVSDYEWNMVYVRNGKINYPRINSLMFEIIGRSKRLIQQRPKGYKEMLSLLLKGLHNLPRAYMSDYPLWGAEGLHIEEESAIEYSRGYLKGIIETDTIEGMKFGKGKCIST